MCLGGILMLEQEFADQTCRDAKGTQRRNAAYFGCQFNSECDNVEQGYRTVTVISWCVLCAICAAQGARRFDRRLRCRKASKSLWPSAWLVSSQHAASRKKRLYLSHLSRSQSSQCTQASTSNIVWGRAVTPVPDTPYLARREALV